MIWNYRGVANGDFVHVCRLYLKDINPNILVILETRTDSTKLISTFNKLGFDNPVASEAMAYTGGIVMA